jgi:hypothetical protein
MEVKFTSHSLRQRSHASLRAGEAATQECSLVQACRGGACAIVHHCVQGGGACADCRGGGEPATEEVSAYAGEAAELLCRGGGLRKIAGRRCSVQGSQGGV